MPPRPTHTTAPGRSPCRSATLSIGLLAAAALAYLAALEIGARVLYPAHSALAARIRSDWSAARQLGVSGLAPHRNFLVVGNSLLEAAIDREELGALTQDDGLSVAILPIENTEYLDWYFGLQRLLLQGSRPDFVVLSLVPAQLISNRTDGEFFARRLMRPVDILRVKQAAHLDWTSTSTYLMASASAWIGDSAGIRNWIRSETVPGMSELARYFPQRAATPPPAQVIEQIAEPRLRQFAAVCAAHGCKALLLIPPLMRLRGDQSLLAVARAARTARVPVLMPVAPGELAPELFPDGFHLSQRGAQIFTPRLVDTLRRVSQD
jgi:hypothetical protein